MNLKIGIISGCTFDYFGRMLVLYKSLRQFHKDIYFIAYMIGNNDSEIEKENELKEIYEKKEDNYLIYKQDIMKFENNNYKKIYSSNARIKYLKENYEYYDCLFWMDADTIILKNIDSLFTKFKSYKVIAHDKYNNLNKILSGIIGFKKSKKSSFIINNWYDEIMKNNINNLSWGSDQIFLRKYLKLALEKYKNQKNFYYRLPYNYISWSRIPKPIDYIIVGKGDSKYGKKYLHYQKIILKNSK